MSEKLWLNEAMIKYNKKLYKGVLNIVNAPAGSGKSSFVFNELINESYKYVNLSLNYCYSFNLDKLLYVCDTSMLKSSILKDNTAITKILEKNDLKKAMKSKEFDNFMENATGEIKVITYSTLGWLLQQKGSRHILLNYIDVFLFDEMHNLFKYANRFDNEENGKPYGTVIEYLPTLISKSLVVGLSATPSIIYSSTRDTIININSLFNRKELQEIRTYKNGLTRECNNMMNEVKRLGVIKNFIKEHDFKIFIYTNTISMSRKYKEQLERYGYKVEWLCSDNNKTINDDGEKIPTMNKYQFQLRKKLLEEGILPDDLEVLIVNGGYETGWNLRDKKVKYVMVDSKDYDTQIQARNRVRQDISFFVYTVMTDEEGRVFDYNQFREKVWTGVILGRPYLKIDLDDKYIENKLTSDDRKYLVDRYGTIHFDKKKATWNTFKKDLEANLYYVHITNNGIYIFNEEQHEKSKTKKIRGSCMNEKFINFLESEWDKKRITCQDVMDILDIGRKTFDKLIKDEEIIKYFQEKRYKVGTIKNSKTKYLMKY